MFSECECFGIEKDSCGIYAVTVKALIIVAVFFPRHPNILCSVTGFLCGLGQVVWSQIFLRGLVLVYAVLTVGVEDTGMWLSIYLCFSFTSVNWSISISPIPILALSCLVY